MTEPALSVAEIQRGLARRGYDPGPIDGDPGPLTVAALARFQGAAGLVPDGIAGPLTSAALRARRPLARPAPREPGWLALARREIGTAERRGPGSTPAIVSFFRDAGFPAIRDDAVAWCAAFVGAILRRSGHVPSGSLAARSYERWGEALPGPALGAIGVKRRAGASWQGHVGFVVAASPDEIALLGGNQADAVSVARFPRAAFTAFRWPDAARDRPDGHPLPRLAAAGPRPPASES